MAQPIQFKSENFAKAGEQYLYSRHSLASSGFIQKTGEKQVWDFSELEAENQYVVSTHEPPQAGKFSYEDWPEIYDRSFSTLAVSSEIPEHYGDWGLLEPHYYLQLADSGLLTLRAIAGKFEFENSSIPFHFSLDTAKTIYPFPLSYQKSWEQQIRTQYLSPSHNAWFTQSQRTRSIVDAWGEVRLPTDTFSCLRIRTEIVLQQQFSLWKYTLPLQKLHYVNYEWLSPESGLPVMIIKTQLIEGKEKVLAAFYQDEERTLEEKPFITNDATVLGLLILILAGIFFTSQHPRFRKFYAIVPALLLCYFIPSLFNTFGIISGESSSLYFVASRYLLPTSLVLLCLSIDLKGILGLGPKAIIMFLAGTLGIIIGGPLAIMLVSSFAPDLVGGQGPEAVWRGLSTVAGSWIGGGANQTAMKEVFQASDRLFSSMIAVDVIVANLWMAFLLYGAGKSTRLDKFFKADSSSIESLKHKLESYQKKIAKIPSLTEVMVLMAAGFGITALAHFGADHIAPWIETNYPELKVYSLTSHFFWLIVLATTGGVLLSFTKARKLEGVGASRFGSLFLYILIATLGMKMDITAIAKSPGFFLVGIIWMLIHVVVLLGIAKLIKAPFFFTAVGSQANVGGAASAPVVASAFHPSLATVGVLLAVFGYALGTYAAYLCALLMQAAAT